MNETAFPPCFAPPSAMPALLEDLPAIFWICDPLGHWLYCNKAAQDFLGRSFAEVSGLGWIECVHREDRDRISDEVARAIEQRRGYDIEYRLRRHDGAERWLAARGAPWLGEDGEFFGLLSAASDVTPQREAAEKLRARPLGADTTHKRFARILEATTDLVGMSWPDGSVLYLNEAGRTLLGFGATESLPARIEEIHPAWANEIVQKAGIPAAKADGYWKGETALLRRDGQEVPVSQVILSHPGPDGSIEFLSTIMRDISDRKREEIARIEWANRYDAAIRASEQLLFDWNSVSNEITYAGDIEKFLGFTMSEMEGGLVRFRQLVQPVDRQRFDEEIQRVTATRDPFRLDFRLRRKDAREIVIAAKGYFFLDRRGHFGRMVGFLADITAQRAAQDALAVAHEHLEARVTERTAELARAYSALKDRALQQEMVAALGQHALTGVELKALLDEAAELVRTTLRTDYCSILELAPAGNELRCMAESGWPDPALSRVQAGYDSQSGYTLLVRCPVIMQDSQLESRFKVSSEARDSGARSGVTVVIDSEERPLGVLAAFSRELRRFTQDDIHFLQSVANVLTAAIDRKRAEENIRVAHEQAERANRAKSEFLSRMSHELRTPLNAILGFTQLLEIDAPTPSQAESVDHVSRAGKHLLSLINEVLDISRIESGRLALAPEPIELDAFLRETLQRVAPLAARHEVTVIVEETCERPLQVLADRGRLQQVFVNLLSNGVKYNRAGGRVTVSCGLLENSVRVSVADTGPGISEENLARLFIPFERLGAEATDVEGAGIGLALARGIVTALGGELGVHSIEGQGSTFWVVLPRAAAPESPATVPLAVPAPPEIRNPEPRVVLYIEDEELNVRLVERIFHSRPQYRLLTAMRGALGLEMARSQHPHIILLDLNLPDMTGIDILRRVKENNFLKCAPVVVLTTTDDSQEIKRCYELGCNVYITKPVNYESFANAIRQLGLFFSVIQVPQAAT